ncbi:hypothetical protein H0H81_009878 [Sphagnurus paluster]|uniref:Uncharacterized protein n=1 Tax=Sphagnurus paluster TaxID=117069 RepID=A0A9P7K478_9AGAR|nr:hypothetical protein H0H81_009878 [Sphagnurus paluster]
MGNGKRKAPSPAESTHSAPSRPVSPVHQASNRGDIDHHHAQDHLDNDSSSELEYLSEAPPPPFSYQPVEEILAKCQFSPQFYKGKTIILEFLLARLFPIALDWAMGHSEYQKGTYNKLTCHPVTQKLIANAVSKALAEATPPPQPLRPAPYFQRPCLLHEANTPPRLLPHLVAVTPPPDQPQPHVPPSMPLPSSPLPAGSQADLRRGPQVQGTSTPQDPPTHQAGGPCHNQVGSYTHGQISTPGPGQAPIPAPHRRCN